MFKIFQEGIQKFSKYKYLTRALQEGTKMSHKAQKSILLRLNRRKIGISRMRYTKPTRVNLSYKMLPFDICVMTNICVENSDFFEKHLAKILSLQSSNTNML